MTVTQEKPHREMSVPPPAHIMQVVFGYMQARALYVVAQIGIADLLKDGPKNVAALAAATQMHEGALYRVLRALASLGIFVETAPLVFALNPPAETLRSDRPDSMRPMVLFSMSDRHWTAMSQFTHSVRTGQSATEHVFGMPDFEYMKLHPEEAKLFNDAMRSHSSAVIPAILEAYDFGQFGTIADIAGGQGHLLAAVLARRPNAKGILFDLPHAIEDARRVGLLNGQAKFVAGDFFDAVPEGADAYMLKHIIHDWDDEKAGKILVSCRRAIAPTGKLLIMEMILPGMNEPGYAKLLDLVMLAFPGGLERTTDEYSVLLANAGFELARVVPTRSPISIIEAVPA